MIRLNTLRWCVQGNGRLGLFSNLWRIHVNPAKVLPVDLCNKSAAKNFNLYSSSVFDQVRLGRANQLYRKSFKETKKQRNANAPLLLNYV